PRRLAGDELLDPLALAAICGHPLLRCLMQATAIADIELERLLTGMRFALLKSASAEDGPSAQAALATPDSIRGSGQRGDSMTARAGHSPAGGSSAREEAGEGSEILEFCCALARQCFLNEQVFALTDEERGGARRLGAAGAGALAAGGAVAGLRLALVASSFPLHALPGAERLPERAWSAPIAAVLDQQVRAPAQERQLRASIPVLTAIEDKVSRKVRQQYEENPYPRWEKAEPAGQPLRFDQYLRRRLPAAVFRNL